MATATYVSTKFVGIEPECKSVAVIDVNGTEVEVSYWPSLIDQWTKDGVKTYVEAEALYTTGNYSDAHARLAGITDAWAQQWIDEHPIPAPVQSETDPLL